MRSHTFEQFGEAVRTRRLNLGLTQADVAALAGCSTLVVHKIEHAKGAVHFDMVVAVCRAVGLVLSVRPGAGGIEIHDEL